MRTSDLQKVAHNGITLTTIRMPASHARALIEKTKVLDGRDSRAEKARAQHPRLSEHNRPVDSRRVHKYKEDIIAGRFNEPNPDALSFEIDGETGEIVGVREGQTRTHAAAQAGVEEGDYVPIFHVELVPVETKDGRPVHSGHRFAEDLRAATKSGRGRARTLANDLKVIADVPRATNVASIARLAAAVEWSPDLALPANAQEMPSDHDLIAYIFDDCGGPDIFVEASRRAERFRSVTGAPGFSISVAGAHLVLAERLTSKVAPDVMDFFDELEGIDPRPPVQMLHRKALGWKSGSVPNRNIQFSLIAKAMHMWLEDSDKKTLGYIWKRDGNLPIYPESTFWRLDEPDFD